MRKFFIFFNAIIIIGLISIYSSLYHISGTENGVQIRAGKLPIDATGTVKVQYPGIHFKVPFWDSVLRWDNRMQHIILRSVPLTTTEEINIILDYRVSWHVKEPARYAKWMIKNQCTLDSLLLRWLNENLQANWKPIPLCDLISDNFESLQPYFEKKAKEIGIEVVNSSIIQKVPSSQFKKSIITQMSDENLDTAAEHIKNAKMQALNIQSESKTQQAVLLANAQEKAEHVKNEGESKAMQLYTDIYSRNLKFASVYQEFIEGMSSLDSHKPTFVVMHVDSSTSIDQ